MKFTLPSFLNKSRLLKTEAGQQLQELIEAVFSLQELTARILRNNVTPEDNMNVSVQNITVKHDVEQVINASNVVGIRVRRAIGSTIELVTGFGWYVNGNNQTVIKAQFDSADPARDITLVIVVEF